MKLLFLTLAAVAVDYASVVGAVGADLLTGVARARREGRPRLSRHYRRTVSKLGSYLATLAGMTAIDAVVTAALCCARQQGVEGLVMLPVFTTLGALGLLAVEVKSICENGATQGRLREAARVVIEALRLLLGRKGGAL